MPLTTCVSAGGHLTCLNLISLNSQIYSSILYELLTLSPKQKVQSDKEALTSGLALLMNYMVSLEENKV